MGFVGSVPVDGFAEIHFMTFKHLEEVARITASRAEKVTVFMDNYYVEKNLFGSKSGFPKMCVICKLRTATIVSS